MSYTKGPWHVAHDDHVINEEGIVIAMVGEEANAHLIAAAPDLVEALQGLMQHMPDYPDASWQNALEALRKAGVS